LASVKVLYTNDTFSINVNSSTTLVALKKIVADRLNL
jgi:hypothetical protein